MSFHHDMFIPYYSFKNWCFSDYSKLSPSARIEYELIKIDKSLLWPCFDKNNPNR